MSERRWRYKDDLSNLPRAHFNSARGDEWLAVWETIQVLSKHAAESRDAKMAGQCAAAYESIGHGAHWLWEDCLYLFDEYYAGNADGGAKVRKEAREFFASGIRRRPHRILRAEAIGLIWSLRWLYRAGLLRKREIVVASNQPFVRSREGQRRQAIWEREDQIKAERERSVGLD